jgi:hypothetical protein
MRVFDISTMNRLRTDSLKLIIDDGRWMSVRAGGKHPFGGLPRSLRRSLDMVTSSSCHRFILTIVYRDSLPVVVTQLQILKFVNDEVCPSTIDIVYRVTKNDTAVV